MNVKLSKGNILVEYIGGKKKGHQEVKVLEKNEYVTDVSIGDICLADVEKATDVTVDACEMAIKNIKFIKAIK